MILSQTLALWADRLLRYVSHGFTFLDQSIRIVNYEALQEIALDMIVLATGVLPNEIEPLRASMLRRPTPLSTGDAAIIDDTGRILLIRRADNGLWAMPGGALAVGETPAEGVAREALEETGVRCKPVALVGVHDLRLCGTVAPHHLYQFLFLCQPLDANLPIYLPSHAVEVLERAWFTEHELPSTVDPGHVPRIPEAFRVWRGNLERTSMVSLCGLKC